MPSTQQPNTNIRFSRSRKIKCEENVRKLHGSMLMYLAGVGGPSGGQVMAGRFLQIEEMEHGDYLFGGRGREER